MLKLHNKSSAAHEYEWTLEVGMCFYPMGH